jgi:hypothetical protein
MEQLPEPHLAQRVTLGLQGLVLGQRLPRGIGGYVELRRGQRVARGRGAAQQWVSVFSGAVNRMGSRLQHRRSNG